MLIQYNPLDLLGLYFVLDPLVNDLLWLGHEIFFFYLLLDLPRKGVHHLTFDVYARVKSMCCLYTPWKEKESYSAQFI